MRISASSSLFIALAPLLLLALLFRAVSAIPTTENSFPINLKIPALARRQATPPVPSCLSYATVANLSTIGTNSTFRAAFQQNSPWGTDHASGVLDGATKTLLPLINNQALNQACGNLTAVAIQQAPVNFSQGIVGEFRIRKETQTGVNNGIDIVVIVAFCVTIFGIFIWV